MKRILLFLLLTETVLIVQAQDRIDTLYYNKSGKIIRNTVFADYYRIALYPSDSVENKEFKDFYNDGNRNIKKEGCFQTIDSLDDNKTVFDGDIVSYFRNGNISEKSHYTNGVLNGEVLKYNDNGTLVSQTFYIDGKLSGAHKTYNNDGSCKIVEYRAGEPLHDFYILSDCNGNTLKYRIDDDSQIMESPEISERFIDYHDGTPYEVYFKNGLTVASSNAIVRDYGKWHKLNIIISNNSTKPIEFAPETDITAYSVNNDNIGIYLPIWSCDEYMKQINAGQTLATILMAIGEGMSTAGVGYSTSTTHGYSSRYGYYTQTTDTYNHLAAQIARAASRQRMANFCQNLQDEKNIKQLGYLKRNTIYPGESISGYVLAERIKGSKVVFIINIDKAEYLYEWDFNRKRTYTLEPCYHIEPNYILMLNKHNRQHSELYY